jgi:hypothetical protein
MKCKRKIIEVPEQGYNMMLKLQQCGIAIRIGLTIIRELEKDGIKLVKK